MTRRELLAGALPALAHSQARARPNIIFIMSDDHASHAISAYGSKINQTPNIDRIARGGVRLDNCFVTNSICTPSRGAILTGQYSHINGIKTLDDAIDPKKIHLAHLMRDAGYCTDLIGDFALDFLSKRDKSKPFFLMCHHKAPHREWTPSAKYKDWLKDTDVPEPDNLYEDLTKRSAAAQRATLRVGDDMTPTDLKVPKPEGLQGRELRKWAYQLYIKDYLRCVRSVDDNVGRVLDYLDANGLAGNTIVIYTSHQGFFLGDHGWFDKRFMYEETMRMPFVARYPK